MSDYRIRKDAQGYWIEKRTFVFFWSVMDRLQDGDYWDYVFAIPTLEEAKRRLSEFLRLRNYKPEIWLIDDICAVDKTRTKP